MTIACEAPVSKLRPTVYLPSHLARWLLEHGDPEAALTAAFDASPAIAEPVARRDARLERTSGARSFSVPAQATLL
jgi:hypothetical protein